VALVLLAPPLRTRVDGLADLVGGWIETVLIRVRILRV
jgi:hypothetical protein